MSETKHTPGPWLIDENGMIYHRPDPLTKYCIAEMESGLEANASLIAAAPDLLAALKKMLPEANRIDQHLRPTFETCEEARAAIAKAEGGAA